MVLFSHGCRILPSLQMLKRFCLLSFLRLEMTEVRLLNLRVSGFEGSCTSLCVSDGQNGWLIDASCLRAVHNILAKTVQPFSWMTSKLDYFSYPTNNVTEDLNSVVFWFMVNAINAEKGNLLVLTVCVWHLFSISTTPCALVVVIQSTCPAGDAWDFFSRVHSINFWWWTWLMLWFRVQ